MEHFDNLPRGQVYGLWSTLTICRWTGVQVVEHFGQGQVYGLWSTLTICRGTGVQAMEHFDNLPRDRCTGCAVLVKAEGTELTASAPSARC